MSSTTKSMLCVACVFGFATSALVFGNEFDPNAPAEGPRVQVDRDRGGVRVDVDVQGRRDRDDARAEARADDADPKAKLGNIDSLTSDKSVRASQLMNQAIYNAEGNQIGSIKDLVLDVKTGEVRYVAVSFGGFLGFGDKLFAMPWKSFETRRSEDFGWYYLQASVNEEMMKEAPGFDQNNWPDFSDERVTERVDNFYRTRRQ